MGLENEPEDLTPLTPQQRKEIKERQERAIREGLGMPSDWEEK